MARLAAASARQRRTASIAALCTPKRRSVSACVGRSVAASGKCVFTKLAHLAPERCGRVVGLDADAQKSVRSVQTWLYGTVLYRFKNPIINLILMHETEFWYLSL